MRDFQQELLRPPVPDVPGPRAGDTAAKGHERPSTTQGLAALNAATVMNLQRTAGNQGVIQLLAGEDEPSPVHQVIGSGGGMPLDTGTRTSMESAFGTSFEHVRVHADESASKSAESVGANAYTVGSDIVFRAGHFDPGTKTGQRTIAHELSHVLQQSKGQVDGTDAPGGIKVSSPSDRFEQAAEHQAERVMSSAGSASSMAASPAAAPGSVQREEDPATPMPAVQREGEMDEEELGQG